MSKFVAKSAIAICALGLFAAAPANAASPLPLDDVTTLKILVADQEGRAVQDEFHPDQDSAGAPVNAQGSAGGDPEIQGLKEEFPETNWPKK